MLLAIGMFTGMSVAPVAAAGDGLDLGDDGISVGGEDGVEVGTDDGVNVSAGGDEGVEVGADTDGVDASVAGEDVGTDDAVSEADAAGNEAAATDADTPDAVDGVGAGEGLNATEVTGLRVCDLSRTSNDDLPTGALPGLDSIPADVAPSAVPTNLLTTEAVAGIALGAVPNGCEVVDPEDPQLDPTDPPTDPDQSVTVARSGRYKDGVVGLVYYDATLDGSGDGPAVDATPGYLVTSDIQALKAEYVLRAGESEYGTDSLVRRDGDDVRLKGVAILVGGRGGVDAECDDLREFDGDLSEENLADLGPCEYELVGLPEFVTVADVVEALSEAGEEPPVDPGELPVGPDELSGL